MFTTLPPEQRDELRRISRQFYSRDIEACLDERRCVDCGSADLRPDDWSLAEASYYEDFAICPECRVKHFRNVITEAESAVVEFNRAITTAMFAEICQHYAVYREGLSSSGPSGERMTPDKLFEQEDSEWFKVVLPGVGVVGAIFLVPQAVATPAELLADWSWVDSSFHGREFDAHITRIMDKYDIERPSARSFQGEQS